MSMTSGSRHGAEINVTPLIDVLLVLYDHLHGDCAATQPWREKPTFLFPQKLTLRNRSHRKQSSCNCMTRARGNRRRSKLTSKMFLGQLGGRLRAIFRAESDRVAFLKGDSELEFQYVAQAIDVAHMSGA